MCALADAWTLVKHNACNQRKNDGEHARSAVSFNTVLPVTTLTTRLLSTPPNAPHSNTMHLKRKLDLEEDTRIPCTTSGKSGRGARNEVGRGSKSRKKGKCGVTCGWQRQKFNRLTCWIVQKMPLNNGNSTVCVGLEGRNRRSAEKADS